MTTAAATVSRGSGATAERRRWLVPTLSLVVLTVAILQTAVVPALDVIAGQLNRQLGGHRKPGVIFTLGATTAIGTILLIRRH